MEVKVVKKSCQEQKVKFSKKYYENLIKDLPVVNKHKISTVASTYLDRFEFNPDIKYSHQKEYIVWKNKKENFLKSNNYLTLPENKINWLSEK